MAEIDLVFKNWLFLCLFVEKSINIGILLIEGFWMSPQMIKSQVEHFGSNLKAEKKSTKNND